MGAKARKVRQRRRSMFARTQVNMATRANHYATCQFRKVFLLPPPHISSRAYNLRRVLPTLVASSLRLVGFRYLPEDLKGSILPSME
eukprot:2110352-Pleurochrysis_carterae.AAC.1